MCGTDISVSLLPILAWKQGPAGKAGREYFWERHPSVVTFNVTLLSYPLVTPGNEGKRCDLQHAATSKMAHK